MQPLPFPKRVTIELTNRCNRLPRCLMCPRSFWPDDMERGIMTDKLFHKIMEEIADWQDLHGLTAQEKYNTDPITVLPFFRGESLGHPKFIDFLNAMSGVVNIELATNGLLLRMPVVEALIAFKGEIMVSLSLGEDIKVEPHEQWVYFLDANDKAGHPITTRITMVRTERNPSNFDRFVEKWTTIKGVDSVKVFAEHSLEGVYGHTEGPAREYPCRKSFEELVILWDGTVVPCNHSWEPDEVAMGNINVHTIQETWTGIPYDALRRVHNVSSAGLLPDLCKNCNYEC